MPKTRDGEAARSGLLEALDPLSGVEKALGLWRSPPCQGPCRPRSRRDGLRRPPDPWRL